jgi:cell division septal protein FtsQ
MLAVRRRVRALGRWRLTALGLLGVLAVAAGGWAWLRDSSLVRVRNVTVTGVSGPEAEAIRDALRLTAYGMTTVHLDHERLRGAVSAYPVIKDLRVQADFPSSLRIHVVENAAVAAVKLDGRTLGVGADGTLLRGAVPPSGVPTIALAAAVRGDRVTDARTRQALAVVANAPGPLRAEVARAYVGAHGPTALLRDGPAIYFGDATRIRAKWAAAARLLGDETTRGARYLDVSLPERPASGGTPAAHSTST